MAKKKLKKITFHPITSFVLLIVGVILLSFILSLFNVSATLTAVRLFVSTCGDNPITPS